MNFTFRTVPHDMRDVKSWPIPEISILTEKEQEKFIRRKKAIQLGLEGGTVVEAAKEAGCTRAVLYRQLTKCLQLDENGKILGWYGIWPRGRHKPYERSAPQPTPQRAKHGSAGAFKAFLKLHPDIVLRLNAAIEGKESEMVKPSRLVSRVIYQMFLHVCRKIEKIGEDEYPLNTKDKGRRSVERYIKSYKEAHPKTIEPWYGKEAASRSRLGNGKSLFEWGTQPLDEVSYDAHHFDVIGTLMVPGPKGLQPIPVTRLWVGVIVDKCSTAGLGYSVATCFEPSSLLLEEALISASTEWQPRSRRIPGISYLHGAGLPFGTIENMPPCRPARFTLDNAAQHFAHRVINGIRKKLGCAIEYGGIGSWWHHALVERFLKELENLGFHRLPSSTGTGPSDPLVSDPVAKAVQHKIEQRDLIELVDVIVANKNATPSRTLGNQSPLQIISNSLQSMPSPWLPRIAPPETAFFSKLGISIEFITVRGSIKKGRAPYVQINEVEYTSPELSVRYDLIGKRIAIHINEWDMRTAKCFDAKSGESLGTLIARGNWSQTKHSRSDRKAVNALRKSGELVLDNSSDPVVCYMQKLAQDALAEAKNKSKPKVSVSGSVLARLTESTGLDVQSQVIPEVRVVPRAAGTKPGKIIQPNWSSVRRD